MKSRLAGTGCSTTAGWPNILCLTLAPPKRPPPSAATPTADSRWTSGGGTILPATTRRNLVFATGYYDWPNLLGIPGEELPHVAHYFLEGHRHWRQDVVIIGAGNSAVDAALECWRAGARVSLVHLDEGFDRTVKPWVLPDITNRLKEGSILAHWKSRVVAIHPDVVEIEPISGGPRERLPADTVLAMTGYHAEHRPADAAGRAGGSRDRHRGPR